MIDKLRVWLCARKIDPLEERLRMLFGFLLEEYGFQFSRNELGDARDPKSGKLVFYGPYNAYSFYRRGLCIHILHLVQRDDYEIFVTDEYRPAQAYICSGRKEDSKFAYHLEDYAAFLRERIQQDRALYGIKVR